MPRIAPMRLHRCRTISGETERIEAHPRLQVYADAVYRPRTEEGGGLFVDGRPIAPAWAAASPFPDAPQPAPDESYLYVGDLVLHYRHFMTETLARLWPLAVWEGPRPKLLCHGAVPPPGPRYGYLFDILAGLGFGPGDLVAFDRPVRLANVTVAEPGFRECAAVHAVFGDLCRRVGARYWDAAAVDTVTRPAYLSKTRLRAGVSRLVEEGRVEAELDRLGVEIVHPEELSFPDKVRLFTARRTILGPTASSFHTAAFSAPGRRILGLNWAYYLNANFPLFDGLNGTRAYYYWALGTDYREAEGFSVAWTIPEPERVARELLDSAEAFDRLDARDAAVEADRAARARSLTARLRRWRRGAAQALRRALERPGSAR